MKTNDPPKNGYSPQAAQWQRYSAGRVLDQRPIVWAVDPFANDDGVQTKAITFLITAFPTAPIYPVYVLSEEAFHDYGESAFLRPALKPMAIKDLDLMTSQIAARNIRRPRVLLESSASRSSCARKLIRFSEKIGAEMIALGAHGRHTLTHFFIGSFTNEMIRSSEIPVIFTGPEMQSGIGPPRVIIFPTDFSVECAKALSQVVSLAARLGAELHLFHKVEHQIDPVLQSGVHVLGGGWVSLDSFWTDADDAHRNEGETWAEQARNSGVVTRFISDAFTDPVSRSILGYAAELSTESPILAMVSHTGNIASMFFGSVTKEVIRRSPCPVYVV